MCFAPQRRALFPHLNFQKWSGVGVLCTFWLGNVLRATTACTISTSQLPKVVRTWCVLYILASKCASSHNGVHFFDISTSKSAPNVRSWAFSLAKVLRATTACNCSSLICPAGFAPAALANLLSTLRSHKSLEKHSVSRLSYLFAHLHLLSSEPLSFLIFFLLLFSSLTLLTSAYHVSILSEVWLPNFLRSRKTT